MTFQIRDRVRIVNQSDDVEANGYGPHNGKTGTVESVPDGATKEFYSVNRDNDPWTISYREKNLELIPSSPFLESDFSLDELSIAEDIISQMG